jgi:ribonuclease BN (tRNA processing enzyme)
MSYVEVDGTWQEAGPLRFKAFEVEHDPALRCFGYAFDRGVATIGYSGDTRLCAGLDDLASSCNALVLECNGPHHPAAAHMDLDSVRSLRDRHPDVRFVLTHMGADVHDNGGIADVYLPSDFETVTI